VGRIDQTSGACNSCGLVFPIEEFRYREVRGKRPWIEWRCRECRRKYDTKQKRDKRQGDGHDRYNDYMREYMRGYVPKKKDI
jgi:hypothetical protein